jgi:hypothetical protein
MPRVDEEGGLRGATPKLVIYASTCFVVSAVAPWWWPPYQLSLHLFFVKAAIVLSTSVTFLSLPGLDNIARIAGFVAVFFSTASLTSSVIALLRFKSDVDKAMASVGGEGLILAPVRFSMSPFSALTNACDVL